MALQFKFALAVLFVMVFTASFAQTPPTANPSASQPPAANGTQSTGTPGSILGTVVDESGAVVVGARIKLVRKDQPASQETVTGSGGEFSFTNVAPGEFQLTITSQGFAPQTFSGSLAPGQVQTVPQIALNVADALTEVQVKLTQVEVAEEQIKIEEKQRALGVVPNFYVSYIADAAPLTAKQKFKLAARTMVDPFTFVMAAGAAGIEQAQNHFSGYGQGAEGYGKRYGASYADMASGTFLGGAVFPSLLRQDPRYFYKGTGSTSSRFFYALGNALICKGDNKHWQPNYSNVLGNLAAGGLSNLYYPSQDRNGAALTLENGAIGIASTGIANLFQEFIVRKLTPKVPGKEKKPH
jgi:hypothetical protein